MSQKIEFSVQIFYSDRYPTKFKRVTNLASAWSWCEKVNSKNITAMDIYRKRTGDYITRCWNFKQVVDFWNSLPSKYE